MKNNRKTDNQKEVFEQKKSSDDRRKGIERRWIKSGYTGPERRNPKDRRGKKA
jgi:hypothetical protein